MPGGQMVCITFSKRVSKPEAAKRLARLCIAGGWRAQEPLIEDQTMESAAHDRKADVQTAVTALLEGAPAVVAGAMVLQPIVDALADESRYTILYMVGVDAAFRGLRKYDDGVTRVELSHAGSPYRYEVTNLKPGVRPARLPLTQESAPMVSNGSGRASFGASRIAAAAVFLGSLAALFVLIAGLSAQRRLRRPARPDRVGRPAGRH
ncbi:MAG: hypothetical protein NT029_15315 [Armatimonadetes bacterium]|nr:hypothetical protein [Armatimonadota bacterium]